MKIYCRSLPITTLAFLKEHVITHIITSLKNCVNKKVKCCRCFSFKDLRWFFEHVLGWTGKVFQWSCTFRTITIYGTSNYSNNSTISNVATLLPLIIYSNNYNYYNDKLNQNDLLSELFSGKNCLNCSTCPVEQKTRFFWSWQWLLNPDATSSFYRES